MNFSESFGDNNYEQKYYLSIDEIGFLPIDEEKINEIKTLKSQGKSIVSISKQLKISRGSVYQYL